MTTEATLTLPPFFCPFPPAIHPAAPVLTERALRWLDERGLATDAQHRRRLAAADFGRLVALTLPRGEQGRLQVLTDLNVWYHALDGAYGDEELSLRGDHDARMRAVTELTGRFAAVLYDPECAVDGRDPFVAALRDIRTRLARFATAEQLADWISGLLAYFLYEHFELAARHARAIPDLQTYILYCASGRAARPSLLAAPIAGDYRVPAAQMQSATLRAATSMASVIVCFDNDLISFGVESRRADHIHNLLTVLAAAHGCAPHDVLAEAVALRDEIMLAFLSLRRRARLSAPAARYLDDLGSWIRGQIAWGSASPRFSGAGVTVPVLWTDHPRRASGPLSVLLPAVAWWWTA